ncbi:hypothetical protein I79_012791 [Cricetulus griseus]|uniref:Uncharacterized protein n=1 Tax=Cricetulus griseus TaxID=10029 RepID=G3HPS2_CRIGR|nr:hypothetical protein I79_012791 [Cricetulus griseus]
MPQIPRRLHWSFWECKTESGEVIMADPSRRERFLGRFTETVKWARFHRNHLNSPL